MSGPSWLPWVLVAVSACGRVHYDPRGVDADGGRDGSVASDAPAADTPIPDGPVVGEGGVPACAPPCVDPTFNGGRPIILDLAVGLPDIDWVSKGIAVDDLDRIIVVGNAGDATNVDFAAARLLPDGTFDESFGDGGIATVDVATRDFAHSVEISPSGELWIAGESTVGGEPATTDAVVFRLDQSGNLVPFTGSPAAGGAAVFDVNGADDVANDLLAVPGGGAIATGWARVSGSDVDWTALRLRADGSLDPAYGTAGVVQLDVGTGSGDFGGLAFRDIVDASAFFYIGTTTPSGGVGSCAIAHIDANGVLDDAFGTSGFFTVGVAGDAAVCHGFAPDGTGRLVIAGYVHPAGARDQSDLLLIAGRRTGTLDPGFGTNGIVRLDLGGAEIGRAIVHRPEGGYVIGGASGLAASQVPTLFFFEDSGEQRFVSGENGLLRIETGAGAGQIWSLVMVGSKLWVHGQSGEQTFLTRVSL